MVLVMMSGAAPPFASSLFSVRGLLVADGMRVLPPKRPWFTSPLRSSPTPPWTSWLPVLAPASLMPMARVAARGDKSRGGS